MNTFVHVCTHLLFDDATIMWLFSHIYQIPSYRPYAKGLLNGNLLQKDVEEVSDWTVVHLLEGIEGSRLDAFKLKLSRMNVIRAGEPVSGSLLAPFILNSPTIWGALSDDYDEVATSNTVSTITFLDNAGINGDGEVFFTDNHIFCNVYVRSKYIGTHVERMLLDDQYRRIRAIVGGTKKLVIHR